MQKSGEQEHEEHESGWEQREKQEGLDLEEQQRL